MTKETLNAMKIALKGMSSEEVLATAKTMVLSASQTAAALAASDMAADEIAASLAAEGFSESAARAALASLGLTKKQVETAIGGKVFAAAETTAAASTDVFSAAAARATAATTGLSTVLKGLWATIAAHPIMALIAAVTVAIAVYQKFHKTTEELIDAGNKAAEKVQEHTDKLAKQKNGIEDLAESYARLSKGVDNLSGKNISLSDEDYKEFLDISKQLGDLFPELISGTDEYGNYLLNLSGNYEQVNETLHEMLELEGRRAAMAARDGGADIYKSVAAQVEVAADKLSAAQSKIDALEAEYQHLADQQIRFPDWHGDIRTFGRKFPDIDAATAWIQQQIAQLKGEISVYEHEVKTAWSQMNANLMTALLDNDVYKGFSDAQRTAVQHIVDNLDWSSIDFNGWEDAYQNIILGKVLPAIQKLGSERIVLPFDLKARFVSDEISVSEYKERIQNLLDQLEKAGVDNEVIISIRAIFNIEDLSDTDTLINAMLTKLGVAGEGAVSAAKAILNDAFRDLANSLSKSELEQIFDWLNDYDFTSGSIEQLVFDLKALFDGLRSVSARSEDEAKSALQGYEQLKSSTDALIASRESLNAAFADGERLTDAAYKSISELAGGEENLAEIVDKENGYLILNADALETLIAKSQKQLSTNLKLASSHEKLKYHKLVQELKQVSVQTGNYDAATKKLVNTLKDQIRQSDIQIKQYDLLKNQILGMTDAYTRLADAKALDEAFDYTDDFSGAVQSFLELFEQGAYGAETFWESMRDLVPEDVYGQFEDAGDQIEAGYQYVQKVLSRYFTNDGGSITVTSANAKAFIESGLKNGALTGALESFDLAPEIQSVEDLGKAYGITTTAAFSLITAIGKFVPEGKDIFDGLMPKTLEGEILAVDQKILSASESIDRLKKSGKLAADDGRKELQGLLDQLEEYEGQLDQLGQKSRENVQTNIELNGKIDEQRKKIDELREALEEYSPESMDYEFHTDELEQAKRALAELLTEKYQLEEPTELTISLAVESVESEISSTKEKLGEIAEYDGEEWHLKAECAADSEQFDLLVERLDRLEAEKHEIEVYAGIDDEDVVNALEDIEAFEIHDKSFTVKAGTAAAWRALNELENKTIAPKTIEIRTKEVETGKADGDAHARGSLGLPRAEHNALVGELGAEMVVDPASGTYRTVGDHGAEMVDLPEGAIIFNHKQTEDLLKNGHTNGRGRALAEGNAHLTYIAPKSGATNTGSISDATGSADKDAESWFEKLYKYHQHLLAMDQESVRDYLDWLDDAYKTAYSQGAIALDDAYQYEEEVYEKRKELADDWFNDREHDISLMEYHKDSVWDIVKAYREMIDEANRLANALYAQGFTNDDQAIQELQDRIIDYESKMRSAMRDAYDESIAGHEHKIQALEHDGASLSEVLAEYRAEYQETYNLIETLVNEYGLGWDDAQIHELQEQCYKIEETIQELTDKTERFRDAQQRLSDAGREIEDVERRLNNSHDLDATIALRGELTEAYRAEKDALHALNDERDAAIQANVDRLSGMGFEIEYDPDANRLFVQNLEHLNDLSAKARKTAQELIDDAEKWNDANKANSDQWLEDAQKEFENIVGWYEDRTNDLQNKISLNQGYLDYAITNLPSVQLNAAEYRRIIGEYKDIIAEAESIGVDLSRTIYGNIDTNNRQVLDWNEENLDRFADEIESWEMSADDLWETISTVLGSIGEYDGVDIAFSPILQTEDGPVLLDSHTVDEYIWGLIDKAVEDHGEWTNEDLFRLDAEGLVFDGTRIKNLLADIGETAELTSQSMHFTGTDGALAGPLNAITAAADAANLSIAEFIERYEDMAQDDTADTYYDKIRNYVDNIAEYYRAMQQNIREQVEWYRSQGYSDTSDEVSKLSNLWREYEQKRVAVGVDAWAKIVDATHDAVDEIQNVYDTLHSAADEYAAMGGYLTIDTYQELLRLGPQYLQYLKDENGQYVIDEENIRKVIAAKTEQLAVDNAMTYVERLGLALRGESAEKLNDLLYATKETTDATWGLVYSQLALLDLTDDQYAAALHNIDAIRALGEAAVAGVGRSADEYTKSLDKLRSLLDFIMDMMKQRVEDQIDALKEIKSEYSKYIDMQKESIERDKKKVGYQKTLAAKMKEMAKLQAQIDALGLADDRASNAKRAKLMEDLEKLQEELNEEQSDHAVDAQKDMLDDMEDAYSDEKDAEIKKLEKSIDSTEKLYRMAMDYLENDIGTDYGRLKDELIAWNYDVGKSFETEIVSAWDDAIQSAKEYESLVAAMRMLPDAQQTASRNSANNSNTVVGSRLTADAAKDKAKTANMPDVKLVNEDGHAPAGMSVGDYVVTQGGIYRITAANGGQDYKSDIVKTYAYETRDQAVAEYEQFKNRLKQGYIFHKGGVVGGTARDNERFALVQDEEWVLTREMAENFGNMVDRMYAMSGAMGDMSGQISGRDFISDLKIGGGETVNNVTTNNRPVEIHFGDTNINGASPDAIPKHITVTEDMMKQIAKWLGVKM